MRESTLECRLYQWRKKLPAKSKRHVRDTSQGVTKMKTDLINGAAYDRANPGNAVSKGVFSRAWMFLLGLAVAFAAVNANAQTSSILNKLGIPQTLSTIPSNGDVNPYGVAFVPAGFPTGGLLDAGDILVSNYNNNQNLQGTGTTIVDFRAGQQTLFFQAPGGSGLSTGLAVLKAGFVLVANMPTTDGTSNTVKPGSLITINPQGQVVWTFANKQVINGPWDFTVYDQGSKATVFVSNVLTGSIERVVIGLSHGAISVLSTTEISTGYLHRGDPAALEVGPTGLAYDPARDTLYVASADDNAIFAMADATQVAQNGLRGFRIYSDNLHLHGALALTLAPNGNLICSSNDVVNAVAGQPSELVEFTRGGVFGAEHSVDPNLGGAFGTVDGKLTFAAVDDNTSSLDVWTVN
jgi:hypothetical protein